MSAIVFQTLRAEYFLSKPYFWISCASIALALLWTFRTRSSAYWGFWISLTIGISAGLAATLGSALRTDSFYVMLSAWFIFMSSFSFKILLERLVRRLQRPSRQMLAAVLGTFFLALAVTFLREPHVNSAIGKTQSLLSLIFR